MDSAINALKNANERFTSQLQTIMKSQGLTIAEFRLVDLIEQTINTQDKLSENTKLDTSTLSRQLKKIVDKKMVDKVATGADKRQLVYHVTEEGKKIVETIKTDENQLIKATFAELNENQISELTDLLNRLN